MSVLDLFASALGAFILIAVILFPFYNFSNMIKINKTKEAGLQQQMKDLDEKEKLDKKTAESLNAIIRSNGVTASNLDKCTHATETCEASLKKTFLVVGVEWAERCDVDLYVTDPHGRLYNWEERNHKHDGSDASFSLDMRDGPGIELYESPDAEAGEYKIAYRALGVHGSVKLQGWVIDRSVGLTRLRDVIFTAARSEPQDVASVFIGHDGSARIVLPSQ